MDLAPSIRKTLLDWYTKNRRHLPWRVYPSQNSDPYHVWLREMMLQQTTVVTVVPYFLRFLDRFPTIEKLAQAQEHDVLSAWQGLGYYSRGRNLLKAAKILQQKGFPKTPEQLTALPGVGPYTGAAIAAIAFNYPVVPVDGNIIRVFSRLYRIPLNKEALKKGVIPYLKAFETTDQPGDFAQGLMDLGATICKPAPLCHHCPISQFCDGFQKGDSISFPVATIKKEKPTRKGIMFVLSNPDGEVFLEKRPPKGLFAGMFGFPGTGWEDRSVDLTPHFTFKRISKTVRHTFTHFHLEVDVYVSGRCGGAANLLPEGIWVHPKSLENYALPTLMKKVFKITEENIAQAI